MSATVTSFTKPIKALNPDLPFLAASAAIELDDLIHQTGQKLDSVVKLAELLGGTTTPNEGAEPHKRMLIDPVSADVFHRALAETQHQESHSLRELAKQVLDISEKLHRAEELRENSLDIRVLEAIRDFCIALSRYAAYSQNQIYGTRQPHPYRK